MTDTGVFDGTEVCRTLDSSEIASREFHAGLFHAEDCRDTRSPSLAPGCARPFFDAAAQLNLNRFNPTRTIKFVRVMSVVPRGGLESLLTGQ